MSAVVTIKGASELQIELEQMFREHYPMLYRTAYGMLRNSADAEEVPQAIFLKLLRSGIPPGLRQNAKQYLYRAAVNFALDVIRSRNRQKVLAGVERLEFQGSESESWAAEETHRRLAEAIAELRPATVEILMLRYVHSYAEADIARLLGVSRGTVAIKLFRARARLKKLMRNSLGGKA
jgi:RNA polymerase sigma-70 factor (ECF subfamily)